MTGDDDDATESKASHERAESAAGAGAPSNNDGAKSAVLLDMGPLEETMPKVSPQSPTGSGSAAAAAAAVNRKRPSNEAVVSEGSSRRRPSVVAAEDKTAAGQQSARCRPPPPRPVPRPTWFSSAHVRYGVFALLLLFLIVAFAHCTALVSSLRANLFEILFICCGDYSVLQ